MVKKRRLNQKVTLLKSVTGQTGHSLEVKRHHRQKPTKNRRNQNQKNRTKK